METRRFAARCLLLSFSLCLAATGSAQVVFTLTATANDNFLGYNLGSSYTFVLTTGGSFADTATSTFNASRNLWSEEVTTDNQLWASVGGSGLSGGFVRPTNAGIDPYSFVKVDGPSTLLFVASSNEFLGTIGLTTPNSSAINGIEFTIVVDTATFSFPNAYSQPNDYFAGFNGTFTPVTPGSGRVFLPTVFSGSQANFTFTSLTISGGAAVPEPTTYAALLGAVALGLATCRRCRMS